VRVPRGAFVARQVTFYDARAMDSGAKNRARLWLRSEKLFGLPNVVAPPAFDAPAREDSFAAPEPTPAPPVAPVRPQRPAPAHTPAPVAPAAPKLAGALFAGDDPYGGTDLAPPGANAPAFDAPPLMPDEKRSRLLALDNNEVRGCTK
jgi:hypothetical protein